MRPISPVESRRLFAIAILMLLSLILVIISGHYIYGMVTSGSRSPGLLLYVILSLVVSVPVLIVFSVRFFRALKDISGFEADSGKVLEFSEEYLEVVRDDGLFTMYFVLLLLWLSILALPSMTILLMDNLSRFPFGLGNEWLVFEIGFLAISFPLIIISLILVIAVLIFRRPVQN